MKPAASRRLSYFNKSSNLYPSWAKNLGHWTIVKAIKPILPLSLSLSLSHSLFDSIFYLVLVIQLISLIIFPFKTTRKGRTKNCSSWWDSNPSVTTWELTTLPIVPQTVSYQIVIKELFTRRRWRLVSLQGVIFCAHDKHPKSMQHIYGNIPYAFNCWADPVVHLLLLKRSIYLIISFNFFNFPP